MAEAVHLTVEDCARLAGSVRASLAALQIQIPDHSDLAMLLRECDWAARSSGRLLDPSGGPLSSDSERTLRLFVRLFQLRDVARTLERCVQVTGADGKRIRAAIKRRFNRTLTVEADAQNTIFELEIAATLFDTCTDVEFEEPDVVATFPGIGRAGVACKRVQNLDRLRERIAEGAVQVERTGLPGIIAVDVQPVLYRTGDEKKRVYSDQVDSREQLIEYHSGQMQDGIDLVGQEIETARARSKGVSAVVLCAMVHGITIPRPGSDFVEYAYAWLVEGPRVPSSTDSQVVRLLRSRRLNW